MVSRTVQKLFYFSCFHKPLQVLHLWSGAFMDQWPNGLGVGLPMQNHWVVLRLTQSFGIARFIK